MFWLSTQSLVRRRQNLCAVRQRLWLASLCRCNHLRIQAPQQVIYVKRLPQKRGKPQFACADVPAQSRPLIRIVGTTWARARICSCSALSNPPAGCQLA
jgi:hypothetical protein